MKTRIVVVCTAFLWAGGCGGFRPPKPVTPPELARIRERVPQFSVLAPDGSAISPGSFAGRTLVALGAEEGFVADILPWLEALSARYGRSGERYAVLAIVEGRPAAALVRTGSADPVAAALDRLVRGGSSLAADPRRDFARGLGFVGEGPHVAAVAPDGTLLALVDGTAERGRVEALYSALDGVLAPRGPAARPAQETEGR